MAIRKPLKKHAPISKKGKPKLLNGVHVQTVAAQKKAKSSSNPWEKYAGMFAGDPVFDEVVKNIAENRKQRRYSPDIP